jgi:hypothetical protein
MMLVQRCALRRGLDGPPKGHTKTIVYDIVFLRLDGMAPQDDRAVKRPFLIWRQT